ncbi:MAG TPA: hypothetical protein PKX05_04470, partial [bacterium]|nr:hypothetical protein [bacterium]
YLIKLFKQGKISFETLLTYSNDPEQTKLQLAADGVIDQELVSKKYDQGIETQQDEEHQKGK